jgi:uncharacterized membrane protein
MKPSSEIRPVLKVPLTTIDFTIEAIAILGIISLCSLAVVSYSSLPDIIPTHFNLKGQADDWGNKASIFILPGIGLLLFTGITIIGVMDKKNGILEMFCSSGQKEWCLFLTVTSTFITTYYFYNIK